MAPEPAAAEVLRAFATAELQRVLSARAELRRVGALLREGGWTGVVLKGGVAALGEDPVDLSDVDLLVPEDAAEQVAATLEGRAGSRAAGRTVRAGDEADWHLAARVAPFTLPVEVHYRLPLLDGAGPWEGIRPAPSPGLHLLAPAVHLRHLLVHGAVHHVERTASLRELVLLRSALAACTPEEVAEVERGIDAHPAAARLRAVLDVARALAEGRRPRDPFRRVAAMRLVFASRAPAERYPERLRLSISLSAFALAAGGGEYAGLWGHGWMGLLSPVAGLPPRGSPLRPAVYALRLGWRATFLAGGSVPALALAARARRLERGAERG